MFGDTLNFFIVGWLVKKYSQSCGFGSALPSKRMKVKGNTIGLILVRPKPIKRFHQHC